MMSFRPIWWRPILAVGAMCVGSSLAGCARVDVASPGRVASLDSATVGAAEPLISTEGADGSSSGLLRAETRPEPQPEEETGNPLSRRVWIGGATVAGVASVSGVTFAILAREKGRDAKDKAEEMKAVTGGTDACAKGERVRDCIELRRLREDSDTFLNLAVWSQVGAGLIEVGMGVYGTLRAAEDGRGSLRVSPTVSAQGAAVTVTGEF